MKYILLLSALILSGCSTMKDLFDDDLALIEDCAAISEDVARSEFAVCEITSGDEVACLKQAADAAKAAYEACLQ